MLDNPLAPHAFGVGGWSWRDAAHLLRRAQYGVSPDEIDGPWQEYNSTSGQTEPDFVRSRVMLKSHRVLFSSCP